MDVLKSKRVMDKKILLVLFILLVCFCSFSFTSNNKIGKVSGDGLLVIHFVHSVNGQPAKINQLIYSNNSKNQYMIKELQYFISDISLKKGDGSMLPLSFSKNIHYVDIDLPKTCTLTIPINTELDGCTGLSFRFGIAKEKNKSFLFKNPPNNLMAWPEQMGGGYHYMKLNLKYANKDGQLNNFNCHLGLGKANDSDTATFVDNSFPVTVSSVNPIVLKANKTTEIWLDMDIAKWFDGQYKMDMTKYDGIMDNQDAMHQFCSNGAQAFSLKTVQ